jgi:uncharacterized protein YyaL (SSP411 family)
MLYDNALLAAVYLHAFVVTGEERYRRVAEETLDYVVRELLLPEGVVASSQDADTEGVEGLTFSWTANELEEALGRDRRELLQPFEHGREVLRGELSRAEQATLLTRRNQRPRPGRDDKAIAAWNGLALAGLAEAGRRLERPDYVDAARGVAEFLLGPLSDDEGRLHRSWRAGRTSGAGYLEDYADVAYGLLELHAATGELRWLREANRLARLAVRLFADEERGGFFLAPHDADPLFARAKDLQDHPTPSGNAMLAYVLLKLARIWGDDELARLGAGVLRLLRDQLVRAPSAFGWALAGLDLYLSPPRELAIIGPAGSEIARAALEPYQPNAVVAFGPAGDVPLLAGKQPVDGRPAVYVCERFACRAPVTDPAELQTERGGP